MLSHPLRRLQPEGGDAGHMHGDPIEPKNANVLNQPILLGSFGFLSEPDTPGPPPCQHRHFTLDTIA